MIKDSLIDFDHEKRRKEIAGIKNKVLEKYQGLTEKDLEPWAENREGQEQRNG